MRLLISDPLHPTVPGTVAALQSAAAAAGAPPWTVLGLIPHASRRAGLVPPPGVTELVSVPDAAAPNWRSRVVTLAVQRRLDAVLPSTHRDAVALAPAATELRELGVALVSPPLPLVKLVGDKWETAVRLAELGLPALPARAADRTSDLAEVARELGHPARPLLVKPRCSAGAHGVWSVREDAGLGSTLSPPALPLYALMAAAATCPEPLGLVVQQQVPGIAMSVDVLADDGKVLASVARTQARTLDGVDVEGVVGPVRPPVAELVERLVAALRWSQLLSVQLIWDPVSEQGMVCDLNVGGSAAVGLAGHAGVPLLAAAVELAMTGRPRARTADRSTRFRRYWTDQVWPA